MTAGTSMVVAASSSTRRARTTLSSRPRPTAPAMRDTEARHSAAPGRLAARRRLGRLRLGGLAVGTAAASPAAATRVAQRAAIAWATSSSGSPGASTWLAVSQLPSAVTVSSSAGSTTWAISKPRQAADRAGMSAKPKPPISSGPLPRVDGPCTTASTESADQASATCRKRAIPEARSDHEDPTPSSANPASGWSHRARSSPVASAAAKSATGSTASTGSTVETSVGPVRPAASEKAARRDASTSGPPAAVVARRLRVAAGARALTGPAPAPRCVPRGCPRSAAGWLAGWDRRPPAGRAARS